MKYFVQYGAGNIGRGFIGALFSQAGYKVDFVDVNMELINALNDRGSYPVEIVSSEGSRDVVIENVGGINGMDKEAVISAIASADAMATAVGVNIMPRIVPLITAGIKRRWEQGNFTPFNIIICENLIDADKLMHKLIFDELDDAQKEKFDKTVGLVEASIGRMVPVMTDAMRKGDNLRVCVEEYCQLPVDGGAWKGELANIEGLHPFKPFEMYIKRKLYLHNMGHALCAYLGNLNNVEYIWQAVANPSVKLIAQRAMLESAMALSSHFNFDTMKLLEHIEDLLIRFTNVALGDTVARVGKDTKRKLSASDRFAGALKMCEAEGYGCAYIAIGAAAALYFECENDEGTAYVKGILDSEGVDAVLTKHMELDVNSKSFGYIKQYYDLLKNGADMNALLAAAEANKKALLAPKKIV